MPGPGRIHRRRAGWASRRLGSSPAASAKLVGNAITAIHGYPEVAGVMVDLGDDKPRPSVGGPTSGSGATPSPCPTGPAAATVSKDEARKSLGTFFAMADR